MKTRVKRLSWMLVIGFILMVLAACGAADTGGAPTEENVEGAAENGDMDSVTVIKVADSFPTTNPISKFGTQVWIQRIEELGDGQIQVEYYPAEQLGKAASLLDVVKSKVADVAYLGSLYFTDQLPLSSIVGNPGMVKDASSGTKAYHRLVTEDLYEIEYKPHGIKPLWAVALNPYQMVTSARPVRTMEDFKGLKIRTGGGMQDQVIKALGGTPVSVPAPEIYSSWERGTIDGSLLSLFSWPGYQVDKLAKYASVNTTLTSFGVIYAVNEQVWESWPEAVWQVVLQASQEVAASFPESVTKHEEELMRQYQAQGIEFYEVESEELARWNARLEQLHEEWIQSMEDKGLPAREMVNRYLQYRQE